MPKQQPQVDEDQQHQQPRVVSVFVTGPPAPVAEVFWPGRIEKVAVQNLGTTGAQGTKLRQVLGKTGHSKAGVFRQQKNMGRVETWGAQQDTKY